MQPNRIFELAIATAFAGGDVLATLLAELRLSVPSTPGKLRDRCRIALRKDLDRDYPRRFRQTDLDTICSLVWPSSMFTNGTVPVVEHIFGQLMRHDGNRIEYAPTQVQEYASFASKFDPTCLVAWHIAGEIHSGSLNNCADVQALMQAQQPFFSAPALDEQYTDGHVHLNGLHFDGVILMNQMWPRLNYLPERADDFAVLSALAHALLLAPRLRLKPGPEMSEYDGKGAGMAMRTLLKPLLEKSGLGDTGRLEWRWLTENESANDELGWHWLRRQIGLAVQDNLASAWLWFQVFLWWQYQHTNASSTLRICIHYLQGNLARLRKEVIMDGIGLANFKDINGNTLRKSAGEANAIPNARTLLQGRRDCAEIKVGPDFFSPPKIRHFQDSLCRAQNISLAPRSGDDMEQHRSNFRQLADQWHLCLHFSRNKLDYRVKARAALWESTSTLITLMAASTSWVHRDVLSHPADDTSFVPANWIRGFDVVGDENEARIEVYAPMLRWLRAEGLRRNTPELELIPDAKKNQSLRYLSVHAGEDYAHPLSGMRHIDETVLFCAMQPGDRIGHALAIGIDPRDWCYQQGDMLLGVAEHLDNLVWAWNHACEISELPPQVSNMRAIELAIKARESFELRIETMAQHVAWACGDPDTRSRAKLLYDAWLYRKNCPYLFQSDLSAKVPDLKTMVAVPDRAQLLKAASLNNRRDKMKPSIMSPEGVYLQRSGSTIDEPRKEVTVMLRPGAEGTLQFDEKLNLIIDHDSEDELRFMHVLQDHLIETYRAAGLTIETNPTSNMYIARLRNYNEHPIFRWASPDDQLLLAGAKYNEYGLRNGPIPVTINTDDPGIMPTTLRTEFLLMANAGRGLLPSADLDHWLKGVRELANEQFKKNHHSIWTSSALTQGMSI